jgi:hypothetical protein
MAQLPALEFLRERNEGSSSNKKTARRRSLYSRFDFCGSLQNLILKSNAFRVVLLEPCFRGVQIGKHLEMIGVADLFAGRSLLAMAHSSEDDYCERNAGNGH